MLADVPLGVFLSGGIDSSLIVAMMRQLGRVRSFSIGFPSAAYDESSHAREVAAALDADHREFLLTPADALATVPELADVFTEPFADSSQIPTILVSRLARADVTVVLTGDGGDEVFGGYNRHVWGPRLWQAMSSMPVFFRRALSEGLTSGRLNSATFERAGGSSCLLRSCTKSGGLCKPRALLSYTKSSKRAGTTPAPFLEGPSNGRR